MHEPIKRRKPKMQCSIDDCQRELAAKGYCGAHYARFQKGSDLTLPIKVQPKYDRSDCALETCDLPRFSNGYCMNHHSRFRRGLPFDHPLLKQPVGTRVALSTGYVKVKVDFDQSKWMLEHRLVMGRHLGRSLYAHEQVHHRDGDRANNDIENLELWSLSHPAGQRVWEKLEWARAFIAQYQGQQLELDQH